MTSSEQDLQLSAYDYHLPEELIAQNPAEKRDHSRLLVYHRKTGQVEHRQFHELPYFLQQGDLLALNNTKVFPARIFGRKAQTGTCFEFLLTRPIEGTTWRSIAKGTKRMKPGYWFEFPSGVKAEIIQIEPGGNVTLRFDGITADTFHPWLEQHGEIPYPPYITARESARERYQTVFSQQQGSVAAPTAGLHFTPELLHTLSQQGIEQVELTLHVGLGTFSPVRVEQITSHTMHPEYYELKSAAAERLQKQREVGQRIISVGTTATRTLETIWRKYGHFQADQGDTSLFVYPGQTVGAIDGLITNFHLPQSTLLMLVSAIIGRENLLKIYEIAIAERYRFYSFGDAMIII